MLPIFEFRGVNIEFSDFIAIFNIHSPKFEYRGVVAPVKSKLHGGHFVAPYSIFGHKMTMYIRICKFEYPPIRYILLAASFKYAIFE
jgi:hypothetical protein